MLGMMSGLDRKNCWTIAEHRGGRPGWIAASVSRAKWDADAVRDDLRDYVIDAFGDAGAVLVVDETGDVKKGLDTVGVQRQYTGTAGRIENSQVAVYLTYAAPRGHALIDRALYLPRSWAGDPDRCDAAGIPDQQAGFRDQTRIGQSVDHPRRRRGGAGGVGSRRRGLRRRPRAARRDPRPRVGVRAGGISQPPHAHRSRPDPRRSTPAMLPSRAWQKHSAGCGQPWPAHLLLGVGRAAAPKTTADTGRHHLLIRRNDRTGEHAYLRCYSPRPVPLHTLVAVAGQRWRIEESFQAAKGLTGLDQHQVRRWTSWHRWTTLAMLAHAFLAVATATERDHLPATTGLISLTVNEFRRLFDALLLAARHTITTLLRWSAWRRRHQHRARESHYRRREHQ